MKKIIYSLLVFSLIFSIACSSDNSESDDNMDQNLEIGDYSLIVNGDGFSDERFEMLRDTIDGSGNTNFTASDSNNNSLGLRLPNPVEELQYSIAEYSLGQVQTSSIVLQGSGIYLSENGNVIVSEIVVNGQCQRFKGSFNINYRRQDNAPGNINVQGSFNVTYYSCE